MKNLRLLGSHALTKLSWLKPVLMRFYFILPVVITSKIWAFWSKYLGRDGRTELFYNIFDYVKTHNIAGDYLEFGVCRGTSIIHACTSISKHDLKIRVFAFDSFQGLSELESVDVPEDWDQRYKRQSDWSTDKIRKQFACSLQTVRENLREFDFIHYHEGWIPTRFHEVADKSFSFVHIDVDLYRPILESFQFFYPRLIPHGIMVFDDYGSTQFPAAKNAIDECLRQYNNNFFVSTASGVAFLIKGF